MKVALVTGSGKKRIGNAVVQALAARGYAVAVHYHRSADDARQTVEQLKAEGVRAAAFQADVASESEVAQLFEQTLEQFGRLDVLVTAAAIWERKPLAATTAEDVRRHFEVNTLGTFLCCQQAGAIMVRQPEGGAIITIGDAACSRPQQGYAAYFATKDAIPTLTRAMAVELAAQNPAIRVNCILPGPVLPPCDASEHAVKGFIAGTLLKKLGRPENIAQAVLFLAENDYITGVCLPIDGGRAIAG